MPNVRVRLRKNILWLILDRPPLNILNIDMLDQLTAAIRKGLEKAPRLVVLTGAGERAFCAGVDIEDHLGEHAQVMLRAVHENCAAFEELRAKKIPTVAIVRGHALGGGCELAALCDTIIAHEDASFGLPEIKLGVFPPVAVTYFAKRIGQVATSRLVLTGETITAIEARRLGLVQQVLAARHFVVETEELLAMLSAVS